MEKSFVGDVLVSRISMLLSINLELYSSWVVSAPIREWEWDRRMHSQRWWQRWMLFRYVSGMTEFWMMNKFRFSHIFAVCYDAWKQCIPNPRFNIFVVFITSDVTYLDYFIKLIIYLMLFYLVPYLDFFLHYLPIIVAR